ncbi:MAG: hypothetical protein NZV14_06155 [Bryobacteraceae bacterium]|nr:hypothetical protein [Bryobacteraceae bacterium]MDW8377724.1 hypothetical protein [Bryobacterales bacterium]
MSSRWWIGGLAVAVVAGVASWRSLQRPLSEEQLLGRLPVAGRVLVGIDVAALRSSGWLASLAGPQSLQEADYQRFVAETGFDYRRDLDTVVLSHSPLETSYLVTGRFEWKKLRAYAVQQGGRCAGEVCQVSSSTPGRTISFARLNARTLALASSMEAGAARTLLAPPAKLRTLEYPRAPVWFVIPAERLRDEKLLPTGTRMFATALGNPERLTLALRPQGEGFLATLSARYSSLENAAQTLIELNAATKLLQRLLRLEHKEPNPRDLTGVLTKGEFRVEGNQLTASWPIERVFFENLFGGSN